MLQQKQKVVDYHIELKNIYDGISVIVYKDGTMENVWPPTDRRYKQVQDWIDKEMQTPSS